MLQPDMIRQHEGQAELLVAEGAFVWHGRDVNCLDVHLETGASREGPGAVVAVKPFLGSLGLVLREEVRSEGSPGFEFGRAELAAHCGLVWMSDLHVGRKRGVQEERPGAVVALVGARQLVKLVKHGHVLVMSRSESKHSGALVALE